jgi:branched-chain amino acid transport system substrate-binding protein
MSRRVVSFLATVGLLAAACGQYPGIHEQGVTLGEAAEGAGLGAADNGSTGSQAGVPQGPSGGGGSGAGGAAGEGSASGGGGPGGAPAGGDSTGVSSNRITIGIHAPITGAAPVTDNSFDEGKDLYWKWQSTGPVKIYGRTVSVIVQDDAYNPSHAVQVCRDMAENKKSFLLVGGAGTDQIVACAQYAASRRIPYLSAGVTRKVLQPYAGAGGNYFALSMTYPDQMKLLAGYIRHNLRVTSAKDVALVASNTPNFDDAVAAFEAAWNGKVCRGCGNEFRPDKYDTNPGATGQQLCSFTQPKFKVVVPLVAPLYFLQMAGPNGAGTCHPMFVGVGITMGLDVVADKMCNEGYSESHFFSPAAAFNDVGKSDRAFMAAAAKRGVQADDIMWLLWNLSKTLGALFQKAGSDLTREGFIHSSERASVSVSGFPAVRYAPGNHFGASAVNVLRLHCNGFSGGYWLTEAQNKSRF